MAYYFIASFRGYAPVQYGPFGSVITASRTKIELQEFSDVRTTAIWSDREAEEPGLSCANRSCISLPHRGSRYCEEHDPRQDS